MKWPPSLFDAGIIAVLVFVLGGLICGFYLLAILIKNTLQRLLQGLWIFGFGLGILTFGLGFFLCLNAYWGFVCMAAGLGCWWITLLVFIAESWHKKQSSKLVYPSQSSEGVWPPPIRRNEMSTEYDEDEDF